MKKLIFALTGLMLMSACTTNQKKALILYYSQTGTTKAVAEEIQARTGADICSFDVVQVYDGTYDETIQRYLTEREAGFTPDLQPLACDLSQYDLIFLGYPIWFGTYATPVKALLRQQDFEGKTVVPFCTFGSGGLQSSSADLRSAIPLAEVREGYGVRFARLDAVPKEVDRFLIEKGWKEGELEPLPEYSDQKDVTPAEADIFHAACSGYKYPLGTPVTVGSRTTPEGTDYLFTAEGQTPDGQTTLSLIYITALPGQTPFFTQVVR